MKTQATIQKWGNGLALRVSGLMRDIPHFKVGTLVEVEVNEEGFIVKKIIKKQPKLFPFSEGELLSKMTPESAHVDLLAQPQFNELE